MRSNNGRAGFGNEREAIRSRGIPKCLMLIPHRFAIGCIDRGWLVRNDIVWAKRNGLPDGVTDRFTKKHEYFFFMVKQDKYYFDLDGIKDKATIGGQKNPSDVSDFWDIPVKQSREKHYAQYNDELLKKPIIAGCPKNGIVYDPFTGTGTTQKICIRTGRNYIGSEMSKTYFDETIKQLASIQSQTTMFQ